MIRHIVFWKFRPGTEGEQARFFDGLRGLSGVIPELKSCEVCRSVPGGEYDAALTAEFDSLADLERYQDDPRHRAVSALCKSIRTGRAAIDLEL